MNRGLAAFVFLAAMPVTAPAGEVRARFSVAAEVAPRASLETIVQPATISVTDEDIARGYVEVEAVYRVRNNDPRGYLLRLEPRIGLSTAVEISGLATPVVLYDDVVEVMELAALVARDLSLRFRFLLDAAAPAGVYPLPLRVTVAN